MSNEPLGIYEELRQRGRQFEKRNAERKRMLKLGPAYNGAYSQPINPFGSGRVLPIRLQLGGYHRRNLDHGSRRRETFPEASLGINVAQVVEAFLIESGLTHGDLVDWHRTRRLAWPRHVCMWLIDRYCPEHSLQEIGRLLKRDHTTVIYGIRKTTERLAEEHIGTGLLVAKVKQRLAALSAS